MRCVVTAAGLSRGKGSCLWILSPGGAFSSRPDVPINVGVVVVMVFVLLVTGPWSIGLSLRGVIECLHL